MIPLHPLLGVTPSSILISNLAPFTQIPARCGWSGSRRHPGGVRGHGARWGAHRPHLALWYTPLPGPVAQPTLQTRRDQRAPHRAIAAEGIQTATSHLQPVNTQNQPITKQPTNWDQETVKRLKRAACQSVSNWEQKKCSGGICTFNVLVFTLSVSLGSVPTLLFDDDDDDVLGFFFFVLFSSGHAYDCGQRVQCF